MRTSPLALSLCNVNTRLVGSQGQASLRAQFRLCSRAASITTLRVNRLPLTAPHYRVAVQRKAADSEVPALRLAMAMVHVHINFGAGDMHASRGTQMDLPFPLS